MLVVARADEKVRYSIGKANSSLTRKVFHLAEFKYPLILRVS